MPTNPKIFSPRIRKRKAYATAFRVFFSYIWLNFKSKLFGKKYYNKRIKALHLKNAGKIRNRIQELQGLFIKFGQLISSLSNVLPEEFREPLQALQDQVEAKPYTEIEKTIEVQLGRKPEQIFSNFEKTPIAAASIGQVHKAELDGKEVVVKIQHQNIDTIARVDLEILKYLVKLFALFMDMQGMDHTYRQVRQMIEEELDYTKEANAMQQIGQNLSEVPELRVKIPEVHSEFSTSKVLTAEFCEGVNIGHVEKIKSWGLDTEEIAKRLIELYCKMILVDGFYHADPHPGNIFVNKEGELILLDFGAVAHLTEQTKQAMPELIEAVVRNDTEEIVKALKKMGFLGSDKASRRYVEKLIDIFKEFLQNEVEFDGFNLQNIKLNSGIGSVVGIIRKVDLREVSNSIQIPKDYILLNRTIVLLSGNAFHLAPELNALNVIRPYMRKHILEKDDGFYQLIVNTVKTQIATAISLPNELSKFLKEANDTDMEQELQGINRRLQKIYFLGQQFLFSVLLVVLVYTLINYGLQQSDGMRSLNWTSIIIMALLLLRSIHRDLKA